MYIKSLKIKNIRSIESFEMDFKTYPGWHVLIGDNGSGKSSVIRSIALGLLGEDDAKALSFSEDFANWLPPKAEKGSVLIEALRNNKYDMPADKGSPNIISEIIIERLNGNGKVTINGKLNPQNALWGQYSGNNGWFVAAYGPFRRLRGNSQTVFSSRPRLGACVTAFRDDVALTQLTEWLKNLALDSRKKPILKKNLQGIINFINSSQLLPGGAQLTDDIDSDGIKLLDGNDVSVSLQEMSDGFRSVLSMILDIVRYMIEVYGSDKVFHKKGDTRSIDLPGVVLIDEVDAHLHPTWQTRIGQWFTLHFPKIQFIVSTHSPLVCRACENGSIWRLAAPGSGLASGEVSPEVRNDLINGDILDAYGTTIFGKGVTIAQEAVRKKERFVVLSNKKRETGLNAKENLELEDLTKIFQDDDTIEL